MNFFISGASGFLGRHVVLQSLRQGHKVTALTRQSPLSLPQLPDLIWVQGDLNSQAPQISNWLQGCEVVIHLAAALRGDYETQFKDTVLATESLLQAMASTSITRLIAISSFSVYDYLSLPEWAKLTEDTPLETQPQNRDTYAQIKLIQEKRIREMTQQLGLVATILRPGMIYGKDHLLHAFLGTSLGRCGWLRVGAHAPMPLTYVENCAAAIVKAVDCEASQGETINIVDDHLPTQDVYAQQVFQRLPNPPRTWFIPWGVMTTLSQIAWHINRLGLREKGKLPGLLIPARLHARFKRLTYSNERAKAILGWQPEYDLSSALDRSMSDTNPLISRPSTSIPKI